MCWENRWLKYAEKIVALMKLRSQIILVYLLAFGLQPLARFVPRPNREPKEPEETKPSTRGQ